MELKILEETKDTITFELIGEGHTLCNALKNELVQDEEVEFATYSIPHPLIGIPKMKIKTKKGDPREAILRAIERLRKKNKAFAAGFEKPKK